MTSATTGNVPDLGWRAGVVMRVACNDTTGVRGTHELPVQRVTPLGCGCIRLETTRPGEPTGDGPSHMHVLDGRCDDHTDHAPVLVTRGTLTIRHTRAEGTLLLGTSRGDGSNLVLAAIRKTLGGRWGFRWGGSIDAWFIQSSRDKAADRWTIDRNAEGLRAAGWTVIVEVDTTPRAFAVAEAERNDRAEGRAEYHDEAAGRAAGRSDARWEAARQIRDHIPMGQPILVGHHSEGRHRRALARADGHERASAEESRKADYHANRAEAAAGYKSGRESLPVTLRRIERLSARKRKLKDTLKNSLIIGPLTELEAVWRAEREADLTQVSDELAHWEQHVAERKAAGEHVWGPDDFQKGDFVRHGSRWSEVKRVNRKSLTVPSIVGGDWTDTLPYDKVNGRRRPGEDDTSGG